MFSLGEDLRGQKKRKTGGAEPSTKNEQKYKQNNEQNHLFRFQKKKEKKEELVGGLGWMAGGRSSDGVK